MSPLRTRKEVARFSARSISRVAEARSDAPLAAAFERVGSGAAQAACGEVGGAMVGAGVGTGHGSRGDSGGPGDAGASGDGGVLPDHGSRGAVVAPNGGDGSRGKGGGVIGDGCGATGGGAGADFGGSTVDGVWNWSTGA